MHGQFYCVMKEVQFGFTNRAGHEKEYVSSPPLPRGTRTAQRQQHAWLWYTTGVIWQILGIYLKTTDRRVTLHAPLSPPASPSQPPFIASGVLLYQYFLYKDLNSSTDSSLCSLTTDDGWKCDKHQIKMQINSCFCSPGSTALMCFERMRTSVGLSLCRTGCTVMVFGTFFRG